MKLIVQPVSASSHFRKHHIYLKSSIELIVVKMTFYFPCGFELLNFTLSSQTECSVIHQSVAKVLDRKVCIFGHPDVDLRCDKFFWAEWYFLVVAEKKVIRGV